jgi:folate-binding protein YgfZ
MSDRDTMMAEDIIRSYRAVRTGAGWIDRSAEGRLEVRGADRIAWLQGLLSNDVAGLRPGQGCYATYLTPQGRMLSDARVLVREDACWLDLPAVAHQRVASRLEAFIISEDVELRDRSVETIRLGVHGPGSSGVVARAVAPAHAELAATLEALREHEHVVTNTPAGEVVVAAAFDLGGPGFDVYAPAGSRSALARALEAGGAVGLDADTWDTCRVEGGRPCYGADMDQDTIPLEAGLEDRAISFTKGCYVGQEVIVRVRDRGHGRVARRLMGLAFDPGDGTAGAPSVSSGDALFAGEREIGRVTSAAFSPALGSTIALAYVHRDHAVQGQQLLVRHGARDITATVVTPPFLPPRPGSDIVYSVHGSHEPATSDPCA